MLFTDFYYFIFIGILFILYYLVPARYRTLVLFISSILFIGLLSIKALVFLLTFTTLNYFLGIILFKTKEKVKRRKVFWIGIGLDIGLLAFFKYANFAFENLNYLLSFLPEKPAIPYLSIIIPIGISYYTFQALSYLIMINRGTEDAEKNFIKFAAFLSFFPKFLAGPVERSNHFFPQISQNINFKTSNVSDGLRLFLWGLFKKVVIANNLAGPVFLVYNNIHDYSGLPLIIVMFLQTIHLYFDFSGYTDMALGSAKILGIDIIDNFRRPFFAKNVGELWRRWHISLSSWCNDFIFTPFIVKYRKMGNKAMIYGIFITFFVIGIWHGPKWTFVILGLLQGIAISYEFYTKRTRMKLASKLRSSFVIIFSRIITFIFFSFSLIYFNANDLSTANYFIKNLFNNIAIKTSGNELIFEKTNFFIAIVGFLIVIIIEYYQEIGIDLKKHFLAKPRWVKWTGYYVLIALVYYFSGNQDTFVYLQF